MEKLMSSMNEVNLIGNVGKQPDIRQTNNGGTVMNLSLATSEKWKDKQSGEQKEKTEWHRVSVFGKTAEVLAKYINQGDKLFIRGKMQTRKYQDKATGQDRYATEVVVDGFDGKIKMLGGQNGGQQQQRQPQQQQQQQQRQPQQQQQQQQRQPQQQQGGMPADFDDDIPF
jgi:single-strand DNA-binding protein